MTEITVFQIKQEVTEQKDDLRQEFINEAFDHRFKYLAEPLEDFIVLSDGIPSLLLKPLLNFFTPVTDTSGVFLSVNHEVTDHKGKVIPRNKMFKMSAVVTPKKFIPAGLNVFDLLNLYVYEAFGPSKNINNARLPLAGLTPISKVYDLKNINHPIAQLIELTKRTNILYVNDLFQKKFARLMEPTHQNIKPNPIKTIVVNSKIKKFFEELLEIELPDQLELFEKTIEVYGVYHQYIKLKYISMTDTDLLKEISLYKKNREIARQIKKNTLEKLKTSYIQSRRAMIRKAKFPDAKKLTDKQEAIIDKLMNQSITPEDQERITKFLDTFTDIHAKDLLKPQLKLVSDLVCEHYIEKAKLIISDHSSGDVDREILRKYAPVAQDDIYYCKLCGEQLAQEYEEEVELFNAQDDQTSLDAHIKREVTYLVKTFLRFKTTTPVQDIIGSFSNVISTEISKIEIKMKQIQTNINDSIIDVINLHISIYTFALMAHFIYMNYGKVTFTYRMEDKNGKKKDDQKLIKHENTEDKDDEEFTEDKKEKKEKVNDEEFTEDKKKKKEKVNDEEFTEDKKEKKEKVNDEEFIEDKKEKKEKVKEKVSEKDKKEKDSEKAVKKKVKGGNGVQILQNILTNAYYLILSTKTILIRKLKTITPEKIKPIFKIAYQWASSLDSVKNKTTNTTIKYTAFNPFERFTEEPEKQSGYLGRVSQPTNIDELDYQGYMLLFKIKDLKDLVIESSGYQDFNKSLAELNKKYISYHRLIRFQIYCKPSSELVKHVKPIQNVELNLSKYFEDNGQPRKWSHVLLSNGKKVTIEQLKEMPWKERSKVKFVDYANQTHTRANIPNRSEQVISSFEKAGFKQGFFEYYSYKCPVDKLHEFKNSVCTKCGFGPDINQDQYMTKYKKAFLLIIRERQSIFMNDVHQVKLHQVDKPKQTKWKYDESEILEWSRLVKKSFIVLLNLGFSYDRNYDLISKEKLDVASNATERDQKNRIPQLYSYLSTLRIDYNQLKTHKYLDSLPLTYQGLGSSKMEDLPEFEQEYRALKLKSTPKDICNFLLCHISKVMKLAGQKLAIAMTDDIFYKERIVSKPDFRRVKIDKGTYSSNSSSSSSDEFDSGVDSSTKTNSSNEEDSPEEFNFEDNAIDDLNDGNDDDDDDKGDEA